MSRALFIFLQASCVVALMLFATSCTTPVVSSDALSYAQDRVVKEVGTKNPKGTLVVVDYSKPSSEKRLTVVDLKTGWGKMNSRVAHGVNSGLLYATDFSNTVGSNKSSLGLYKLSEEYVGKHGTSFRLDGLDYGLNHNARKRAIVVHAADYATREAMQANRHEYGRLGRSAGCLALSDEDLAKLDRKIKRPVYVYAYAPVLAQQEAPSDPAHLNPAGPPAPMLASAEKPAAPRPGTMDRPAVARPPVIETGPVLASVGDTSEQTSPLLTVSRVHYRPYRQ